MAKGSVGNEWEAKEVVVVVQGLFSMKNVTWSENEEVKSEHKEFKSGEWWGEGTKKGVQMICKGEGCFKVLKGLD
jgi:hypothetical protein